MTVDSPRKVGSRRKEIPRVEEAPLDSESTLDHLGRVSSSSGPKSAKKVRDALAKSRTVTPGGQRSTPRGSAATEDSVVVSNRIFTIPNILSFLRILLVPLFLWLVLVPELDGWAILVLVVSGLTDYLDGKIARVTGQMTNLGALLDPIADRLFILAVVVGLAMREVIPWWLALSLPLRDLLLFVLVPFLRTRGFSSLPVHFLGKAATAVLLYAFPLLLLGDGSGPVANLARVFGWAFSIWGVALYWWAGALYAVQVRQLLRQRPRRRSYES